MEFKIKEAREKAGYSQKELAEIIGVAPNTFHGYESGKHDPKSDLLIKIANACKVTTDFLLGTSDSMTHTTKKENAPLYSSEALKLAGDYDALDGHGKKVVRLVADEEKARCEEERNAKAAAIQAQRTDMEIADEIEPHIVYIFPGYSIPMSAGTGQPAGDEYPENYRLVKEPPRGASFIAPVSGNSMEPTYHNGDLVFVRAQNEVDVGQIGVFWMSGQQWIKEMGKGELISHNPEYGPRSIVDGAICQGLVLCVCDESYFE